MDNEISILIVEDEEIWIKSLQKLLSEFGFKIAKVVSTVNDALEAFNTVEYDLILMDINIDGRNSGIELGKIVSKLYKKPFIFVTANSGHQLEDAAAANPSAYLPKPINPTSLFFAIQNAINNFSNDQPARMPQAAGDAGMTSFFVKHGSRYKKIDWKDVAYLESGKNYVTVFNAADKSEYLVRSSLQKILSHQVPAALRSQFIQVNRAEAVQFSFVQELAADEVRTVFKTFALSEGFAKELKARMNILS